jgi:LacI family transcriptional regulator
VARYARAAGLRVPEDLSLVGVDNDIVECELITPPLSSVAVPWRSLGEETARLVKLLLAGQPVQRKRVTIAPVDVVTRRSSDAFAVADELVERAVAWIREHVLVRISVPAVARAVGSSRKRLERRFRAALGRTVQEEVRRARVELAKRLLCGTDDSLPRVAKESGFSSAALLSVAFRRELGMPPGAYRRRMAGVASGIKTEDDRRSTGGARQ